MAGDGVRVCCNGGQVDAVFPGTSGRLTVSPCACPMLSLQAAVDVAITALPAAVPPTGAGAAAAAADEVVAVLTSGGRLAVARAVEEDLWQETLEVRRRRRRGGYIHSEGSGRR